VGFVIILRVGGYIEAGWHLSTSYRNREDFSHVRETSKRNAVRSVRKLLSEAPNVVYVVVLLNYAI
jgi:translation initiation factor 2 alpha subunit (eIF-2alpha)